MENDSSSNILFVFRVTSKRLLMLFISFRRFVCDDELTSYFWNLIEAQRTEGNKVSMSSLITQEMT